MYILDRTNGKPLVGVEEKPVPQEFLPRARRRWIPRRSPRIELFDDEVEPVRRDGRPRCGLG